MGTGAAGLGVTDAFFNRGEGFFVLVVKDRGWIVQIEILHASHTSKVADSGSSTKPFGHNRLCRRLQRDPIAASGDRAADQDFDLIVDYLAKNFPAPELPKINVNKATAIELESGLTLRRSQSAAIIEYRTRHGQFKSIEDLKHVPGIDAANVEAKKDRLTF
jgi:competence ComEA-like helix-hairpin-helix protein